MWYFSPVWAFTELYINVRPLKAQGQKIRAAAAGQSLQGYILQAVEERMEREAQNGGTADE